MGQNVHRIALKHCLVRQFWICGLILFMLIGLGTKSNLAADIIRLDGSPILFDTLNSNDLLRISDNGIGINKDATQALDVSGNGIISGNLTVVGTLTYSGSLDFDAAAVFNESGAAVDFRVEGDTDANLLFLDASADALGVGTATPDFKLSVRTGSLGTTAGDNLQLLSLEGTNSNTDDLRFTIERLSNGSDWTTAAQRMQRVIDVTPMGYIQFGNHGDDLITFGKADTEYMRIEGAGDILIQEGLKFDSAGTGLTTNSTTFGMKLAGYGTTDGIGVQSNMLEFITSSINGDFRWGYGASGALTEVMHLDSGTGAMTVTGTAPLLTLKTASNTAGGVIFGNTNHGIKRDYASTGNGAGFWTAGGSLYLSANNEVTTEFELDTSGRVGIGG